MSQETASKVRWTQDDVDARLQTVSEVLLAFLRERTRMDWFKHKVRWRLSRKTIWPATQDGIRELLEQVDQDAGVAALAEHMLAQRAKIVGAIEAYNTALRRLMEQEAGVPVREFDEEHRRLLKQRRITFEGTRDELLRRGRELGPDSTPELIPEILSMRLAILSEDVRDEIFGQVAALIAGERADAADAPMSPLERELLYEEIKLRLQSLDRYHVAQLLAGSYAEARRFMELDALIERFDELTAAERKAPGAEEGRSRRIDILRSVLKAEISYLEEIFPKAAGTHEREMILLR